jgi:hypothetical protein
MVIMNDELGTMAAAFVLAFFKGLSLKVSRKQCKTPVPIEIVHQAPPKYSN